LGIVLPGRTLRGATEVISGTTEIIISGTEITSGAMAISFLEAPLDTIPICMIIRTTDIMTTMMATIPMGNTHQPM
jgi:hypothetical protein